MSTRSPHTLPRLIVAGTVLVAGGAAVTAVTPAHASSTRLTSSIISSAQAGTTGPNAPCREVETQKEADSPTTKSLPGCPGVYYGNAEDGLITVSPNGVINFVAPKTSQGAGPIFFVPDQGFTVKCFNPKTGMFESVTPPDHARPRTFLISSRQTCEVVPGTVPTPQGAARPATRSAHTA